MKNQEKSLSGSFEICGRDVMEFLMMRCFSLTLHHSLRLHQGNCYLLSGMAVRPFLSPADGTGY